MNSNLFIIISFGVAVLFGGLIYLLTTIIYAINHKRNGNNIFNDKELRNEYNKWLDRNFLDIIYYSYSIPFYLFIILLLSVFEIAHYKTLIIIALLVKAIISIYYIDNLRHKQQKSEQEIDKLKAELEHQTDINKMYGE